MTLKLVIGNKNYSSWSMRPWLALRANNIPFEEIFISLYTGAADKQRILDFSGAGKVPILVDGEVTIWDSLAIIEYIAERFPEKRLWPEHPVHRAHARSISAEMHSSFQGLRQATPMNLKRVPRPIVLPEAAHVDVERVQAIWNDCRGRYGKQGHFLFGDFSIADCMYAPVATRFKSYEVPIDLVSSAYIDTIYELPAFGQWLDAALKETWIAHYDSI